MEEPIKGLLAASDQLGYLRVLYDILPQLSEAEQTLVRYILLHPRQVADMSAAEVAAASGVSEATVFRLCRHRGIGGFAQLRDEIRKAVERMGDTFVAPMGVADSADLSYGPLSSGAYIGIRAMLDVCSMGEEPIAQAAEVISRSRRISVCGMGAVTARIAELGAFGFQHLGLTVMLWVDSQVTNVTADKFQPGDVVLGISHSGANTSVARFLKLAKEQSATTIALTNYASSPVAQEADISLVTALREPKVQNLDLLPRMSQLLVMQVLLNEVRRHLVG